MANIAEGIRSPSLISFCINTLAIDVYNPNKSYLLNLNIMLFCIFYKISLSIVIRLKLMSYNRIR